MKLVPSGATKRMLPDWPLRAVLCGAIRSAYSAAALPQMAAPAEMPYGPGLGDAWAMPSLKSFWGAVWWHSRTV